MRINPNSIQNEKKKGKSPKIAKRVELNKLMVKIKQ